MLVKKTRTISLAALVAGAGLLGTFAHANPASAATPTINNVKVTAGGQQVKVAFNLTMKGFSGVEVGRAPLTPGHKTYAQQSGDFVNGSNGVAYAKTQNLTINGLNQDNTYWATIQFQKGTKHFYKRNIAFSTKHRYVTVHISSIYIDGDGDYSGCGEDQAITHINRVPFVYPTGNGWIGSLWTPQESVCHQGYLPTTNDLVANVGSYDTLAVSTAAVDDDTVFGCSNSLSCGDQAFAQTNVNTAPLPDGTESYSQSLYMEGYEGGLIGSVGDSLGVNVWGSYSVWYA